MSCGTGKSIVALAAARVLKQDITVVAPPNLRKKWFHEADKMDVHVKFVSFFKQKFEPLKTTLIIDEAHDILKDWSQSRALIEKAMKSEHVFMLTATPCVNDPMPLYWILKICGRGWTKEIFKLNYCGGKRLRKDPRIVYTTRPTNVEELQKITDKYRFKYMRKENVIPTKYVLGHAPMGSGKDILTYSNIQNILGILKTGDKLVMNKMEEILKTGQSVVFFRHKEVGRAISRGRPVIDGDTSNDMRSDIIGRFSLGFHKAIFLNYKTCGVGVDILNAQNVVFFEQTWSPFKDYQAYMRCYRFERKTPLFVHFLVYKDEAALLVGEKKKILEKLS